MVLRAVARSLPGCGVKVRRDACTDCWLNVPAKLSVVAGVGSAAAARPGLSNKHPAAR
jgi:hypothetical protein